MRDKSFSTDNEIIPTDISIAGSDPNNLSGRYFILWDIVDPRTESNPNPNPNPEPNPKPNPKPSPNPNSNPEPNPKPNPNPDPYCGFTISHKMKYLRS